MNTKALKLVFVLFIFCIGFNTYATKPETDYTLSTSNLKLPKDVSDLSDSAVAENNIPRPLIQAMESVMNSKKSGSSSLFHFGAGLVQNRNKYEGYIDAERLYKTGYWGSGVQLEVEFKFVKPLSLQYAGSFEYLWSTMNEFDRLKMTHTISLGGDINYAFQSLKYKDTRVKLYAGLKWMHVFKDPTNGLYRQNALGLTFGGRIQLPWAPIAVHGGYTTGINRWDSQMDAYEAGIIYQFGSYSYWYKRGRR